MTDLVSVVIPVYNTNDRFKACFESVLNQKYQNIEVILVDDGSFDISTQICDAIALSANSFSVTVIHKPNGGVSRARNLGIDFANGKYIVFIDSDDQVTPNHVADFMEMRTKYPDLGHIWCGFERFSDYTQFIYSEYEPVSLVNRDDYFNLASKVLTQSPWLRLYDVSVLRKHSIRMIEDLSLAEDVIFNLSYLSAIPSKKICIINKANYIYHDADSESLNNKYRDDLKEINDCLLDAVWQSISDWGLTDSTSVAEYYNTVYHKYVEVLDNTFHPQNTMSYFKKIRFNNGVIRSKRFVDALSLMSITIPERLRRAYRTKNYFWVCAYERIISVYGWLHDKNKGRA